MRGGWSGNQCFDKTIKKFCSQKFLVSKLSTTKS